MAIMASMGSVETNGPCRVQRRGVAGTLADPMVCMACAAAQSISGRRLTNEIAQQETGADEIPVQDAQRRRASAKMCWRAAEAFDGMFFNGRAAVGPIGMQRLSTFVVTQLPGQSASVLDNTNPHTDGRVANSAATTEFRQRHAPARAATATWS